jgi:hypothetical protein
MSCEGNKYTFPLKTLAVGSAENWSLIIGFCAFVLLVNNNAKKAINRNCREFFITAYYNVKEKIYLIC